MIHLRYDEKVLVYRLGCMDGGDIGYHLLLQSEKGTSRLAWGKYYLMSAPDSSYGY